jgi:glycosyltransferase involved in cell wall biosynthesis
MRILFHDSTSTFAYDAELMRRQGIGGTEASVVRVAEGLSASHDVVVAQRARKEPVSPHPGLRYVPLNDPDPFGGPPPDWVVVLRKHRRVPALHARYRSSAIALWLHNWQRPEAFLMRTGLVRSGCRVIVVSDAHRDATDRLLNGVLARAKGALRGAPGRIPVMRIYNPVDDALAPDGTPVDPDKLVFFSNKGVEQVLAAFARVRGSIPSLRLHVAGNSLENAAQASPRIAKLLRQPGVHPLGRLPQRELFQHVREALCVFYPQDAHAETFGLVFAESNAVGTPVLAHDFGAAREVLSSPGQLVDARDTRAIIGRLRAWRAGERPQLSGRPAFRAAAVVAEWCRLVEGGA